MGNCQKRATQAAEEAAEPPKEGPPLPTAPIYDSEGAPLAVVRRRCDPFEGGKRRPVTYPDEITG